eukprot:jgi/Phyca11/106045/e_gw1.11.157.1
MSVLADFSTVEIFTDANCDSTPLVVTLEMTNTTCTTTGTCSAIEINNSSYYYAERCATDRFEYTSQLFSGSKYLMIDGFQQEGCNSYVRSNVFLAAGTCQLASYVGQRSEIATLFNDGSAYMTIYNDSACGTKAQTFDLNSSIIQEHTCYLGYNKFYTSDHTGILSGSSANSGSGSNTTATATSHDSKMSAGALFGIVIACLAIVILPALLIYWRLRRTKKREQKRNNNNNRARTPDVALAVSDKHENEERYAPDMSPRSNQRSTVCEDDAILSSRIPRDSVFVEDLIGRGGYGEVYKGMYDGRAVAVKMLFPETRKSTRHVTEFLTEVKMMTVMDHPRVVEFVGVSWNNLMDLCVVTEFMAGGDLRAWLNDRADNAAPVGFDFTKVKIATHVVHALAYLHSLTPSVIHRDLKSRNILLSENEDAKLADFGASRERVDRTMTAGVGTSLWIAPEVMMGERYDDKADMFSFGVVLSELDSQQNPYANAKDKNPAGRKMPETAILQLVAMGKLRVEFSPGALKGMVQLGTACTAIDPTERPSAAEAFRKLQTILAQEAKKAANAK